MATYFARGGVADNISTAEKREALFHALREISPAVSKFNIQKWLTFL